MGSQKNEFQTWLWIELIGFDNEQPDYGIAQYLERAGFVPDAVSLFLFNPDFVHTHDSCGEDITFPFDYSSYGGHPTSYERKRQDWTRFQLMGLVRELQQRGVAVYFSVFDIFVTDQWIGRHPELLHVDREGNRIRSICPWKRMADGTWYEDFFASQLARVLTDYNFDGYHQADGYSHPRLTLYQGDFSDDMVDQFLSDTNAALPSYLRPPCGDDPDVIRKRANYIWRELRREWISFYSRRISRFCNKVARAVHGVGRKVVANQALTREPFQALYRYGVDYRAIADAGVDGFILETVAPGVSLGGEHGAVANPHFDFLAMTLLMKARLPDKPLLCLNSVHDVNEQWDVLRHGPQLLEREIWCNANLYCWRRGRLQRCSDGPVVCLADGLQAHEWSWLREWWRLAFSAAPRRLHAATVVWSDAAFDRQLDEYLRTRRFTVHRLLYGLMAHGAPVAAVARTEELGAVDGPLLVLNPQLFPEAELSRVLAHRGRPLVIVGPRVSGLPAADLEFGDVHGPGELWCVVYGAKEIGQATIPPDEAEVVPEDLMSLAEPIPYFEELYFRKVSDGFLRACANIIAELAGAPRVVRGGDAIRVLAAEMEDGTLRLLITNLSHYYVPAGVDVRRPVDSAEVLTAFPAGPPAVSGSSVYVRVPPQGIVVVEVG
ncbi:MAG: hypothetical protein H5T86_09105 [Armatimonadetes bacterium]|nr:hypothetical protein [Armatimonadota bacterium]